MNLMAHLPPVLQGVREYRALCEAIEAEIKLVRDGCDAVRRNLVISTAEEEGLSRWEQMLGFSGEGSLAERRCAILSRTAQELPYTEACLHTRLTRMVGACGFTLAVREDGVYVSLSLEAKDAYAAVSEMIRALVPANLSCFVDVKLTTHAELSMTHETLSQYTHEMIRNEVATNAENNKL